MSEQERAAYLECQMLPQAQYMMRMKRELDRDKTAEERYATQMKRELDRDEKMRKHNRFVTYIAWATLAVAVSTLVATIIGWGIK